MKSLVCKHSGYYEPSATVPLSVSRTRFSTLSDTIKREKYGILVTKSLRLKLSAAML